MLGTADMMQSLHWSILDDERLAVLPLLKESTKGGFYLAGGTGLALMLGHRDSVDFDFFLTGDFDSTALTQYLESLFSGHILSITQQDTNTVSCLIDETIQLSFLGYRYPLVRPLIESAFFPIASIEDIGCMKLSAITSRSVEKDYIDLYFILKHVSLTDLLALSAEKHPTLDTGLILKSLVYFDDVQREPILFKEGHHATFEEVKEFLRAEVSAYFDSLK